LDVAIGSEVIFPEKKNIIKENTTQKKNYEQVFYNECEHLENVIPDTAALHFLLI
jgi:hypothetical protein